MNRLAKNTLRNIRQRGKDADFVTQAEAANILDSDARLRAQVCDLKARAKRYRSMLRRLEFPEPYEKCWRCLGWDDSPGGRGETPRRHSEGCDLAALLKEKP